MPTKPRKISENARQLRDDAASAAKGVWDKTVEAVESTAKRSKETRFDLESKARSLAATAADKIEKATHDFKVKQGKKRRTADGNKTAATKARKASERAKEKAASER